VLTSRPRFDGDRLRRVLPFVVLAILAMWVIPNEIGNYWRFVFMSAIVGIPIMQSLGVLTGRMGVMSLCQLEFAIIGAWAVGVCNVNHVPGGFYVWLLISGLVTVPFGLLIGLPALRLRGVNLAITTFAFASAVDGVFGGLQFPGSANALQVPRPAGFTGDAGYFRFCVFIVAGIFLALWLIDRSRLGASWIEIRYSERGAAAHGTSLVSSKLLAFGIAAFMAGVGGALMVGQVGTTTNSAFSAQQSLTYFAIAILFGVRYWDSALGAGIAVGVSPAILNQIGLNPNYVTIVFGLGALWMLAGGKGQMGQADMIRAKQQAKRAKKRLAQGLGLRDKVKAGGETRVPAAWRAGSASAPDRAASTTGDALEIHDLTVKFGAVTAVDKVSFALPRGSVVALLGPNGAGKSTLVNAATGFTAYSGTVVLDGQRIDGRAPHRRAHQGLRRSFQQLRVPPWLTVGQFVSLAAGRRLSTDEADEVLDWFGCPASATPIQSLDVGTRRAIEVAGLVAGRPSVLMLDEPAAGQNASESVALAKRLLEIPKLTGTTILLIEHDIDLVRAACESLIVMDFGAVIASGAPDVVLNDQRVAEAYLGTPVVQQP
jgi:branched-chain amino acid transport system permease protein